MSQAKLGALICVLAVAVVSFASAGEHSYGLTRLVGVESAALEGRLDEVETAVDRGQLTLAARGEGSLYFYAGLKGENLLESLGVDHEILMEDVGSREIYMIPRGEDQAALPAEYVAGVVKEERGFYLVAVDEAGAVGIHMLPLKKRLPLPTEAGLPLRVQASEPERGLSSAPSPLIYNPDIQAMVDSVSPSRLYSTLSDLSGENSVVIGGETMTINTRYSTTEMCKKAGQFIRERFEELGLDTEYDYFNFMTQIKSVDFPVDNQTGWVVGRNGLIMRTLDGGLNWDVEESGETVTLWSLVMLDNSHGCTVGNGGLILITDDGSTWQRVYPPTSNDLFGVFFVDAGTGFCCGASGTILKTVNGGSSWTSISSGTSQDLNSICFTGSSIGWVVGTNGQIRRSTDAGSSWSSVSSPVSYDLFDLCFQGEDNGWISGEAGTILRTTDGSTWAAMTVPTGEDLLSVFFISDLMGWTCGKTGAMFKTFDGGVTWHDLNYEYTVHLQDVFFVDNNEGWLTGPGLIYHTTNGGLDWDSQAYGIHAGDYNVVATKPGTTNPDEIYIICGHYDDRSPIATTYAPGADDNGTGTVAAIEAARVLKNYDFEATIRFVCFSREEQGLIGSGAYAREAYEKGDSIVAALNFDMIGYEDIDPENLEIICNTASLWLGDEFQAAAGLYVPELAIHRQLSSYVGSDNSSFWDYDYSSFCGIEDSPLHNPYYHQTTDRVSTLDFDFYTQSVKGGIATLADLARPDGSSSSVAATFEPRVLKARPNPGRGAIAFEMKTLDAAPARLDIYDVTGRLVNTLSPTVDGAMARATWTGRDVAGSPVGAGIYFVRPEGHTQATKVILLK